MKNTGMSTPLNNAKPTTKHPGGRPKEPIEGKVDMEQVEHLAGLGLTDREIATVLGIAQPTMSVWKKKSEELSNTIKKGQVKSLTLIVNKMYQDAMEGNTTAQIFILKNRWPERWNDRRDIHQTVIQKPATMDLSRLTMEELRNLKLFISKAIEHRRDDGTTPEFNNRVG
jgi:predicted XRE-type DNA-binding protein